MGLLTVVVRQATTLCAPGRSRTDPAACRAVLQLPLCVALLSLVCMWWSPSSKWCSMLPSDSCMHGRVWVARPSALLSLLCSGLTHAVLLTLKPIARVTVQYSMVPELRMASANIVADGTGLLSDTDVVPARLADFEAARPGGSA